jgi:phosphoribosylformimino-5-aminoimidazole carboxamide ribotide isomerase
MIVPSIDLMQGRAVQLRRGRELVLDGGDPLVRLEEFAVAGEVAVVDLDAALGKGSNAALIGEMVRRAPCRVGGGIRDLDTARAWLDAGAAQIVIGTAASPDFCGALPRERVIAAVDAERGQVVVEGWRTATGRSVLERIRELVPVVGGFLFTQVEKEGAMGGFDFQAVAAAVRAAGGGKGGEGRARLTAAGGITTATEIAELDRIGADAQVGMALYTGRLPLSEAVAAPLAKPVDSQGGGPVWPTVVCDEWGHALGLVWSTRESLARAIAQRRGVYWSRSRQAVWVKGETSGNTQELVRVDLDCDRDALRFTVRQRGAGFCHLERPACWPSGFDLDDLARTITQRAARPEAGSGTAKLLADPALLAAKLREEAEELGRANARADVVHETADVLYLALVALVRGGGTLTEVVAELSRRRGAVTRRPMAAKSEAAT